MLINERPVRVQPKLHSVIETDAS